VNSGGIYTTPIKTSSSNLNNVDDTNLLSFFIIVINLSNFSLYPKAILPDFLFTENDFPNGGEYLLENYISFLTDSNLPLNRKNIDKGKSMSLNAS
jgi:hypothetical protein